MKKPFSILNLTTMLFLCISLMTSCKNQTEETQAVTAEPAFDLAMAKTEIEAANQMFVERFMAKDSTGVANLYASDGKFMMSGSPAIIGRENIQSVMSGFINSGITGLELITVDVWGTEDLITEEGLLKLYANEDMVDEGKYLVLWKKVDGKWLLFRDIFNSNLAPGTHAE